MVEDSIGNPPHDTIKDLKYAQVYISDDDNTYTLDLSHEETITKSYKENYDEVCMVHDETPLYSPHGDEGLEGLLSCNIFETKLSEEDYYEHEEASTLQEHEAFDEDSPIFDVYLTKMLMITIGHLWKIPFLICLEWGVSIQNLLEILLKSYLDMSPEGSVHLETLGNSDIEEKHSEFAYDNSKSYTRISKEDMEKQCSEKPNVMQSVEYQS